MDNFFFLDDGLIFLNLFCIWILIGVLGMEKLSCVNLEFVEKKYNLNGKIFLFLLKNLHKKINILI